MAKTFITGMDGFIGSHLADFLVDKGVEVAGIVYNKRIKNINHLKGKVGFDVCDIRDAKKIETIVKREKPDYVFHLAAQSFVIPSWKDPEHTYSTNIIGTHNLLEAIRKAGINPAIVVACSSAEYGWVYENETPIKEAKEFRPSSPYAVSKIGTDMLSYLYWRAHGMKIVRARIFNTTGARKKGSALADFSQMIAEVEKGKREEVSVGNLDTVVDITDAYDNVRALWLLATKGRPGEAYNICTGSGHRIGDLLDKLVSMSTASIKVVQDEKKIRPLDDPLFIGDSTKLQKLGWKPEVKIEKTLRNTLDYWRSVRRV